MKLLKTLSILTIIFLFPCNGETGEVIILGANVGSTIDREENEILGLFPDVKGFKSAQLFEISPSKYSIKIEYKDGRSTKILRRVIGWKVLYELKQKADSHPTITTQMRKELNIQKSQELAEQNLETLPFKSFCKVNLTDGKKIQGRYIGTIRNNLQFQTSVSRISVRLDEINSVVYRPEIREAGVVKSVISYTLGSLTGLAVAELWNSQSTPAIDQTWNNRFTGTVLGLLTGGELIQTIEILTSPKKEVILKRKDLNYQ